MKTSLFFFTGIFVVTSAFAYSVKKGDNLSTIAEEHYGNWAKWKDIWKSNEGLITNPNLIYPGQNLVMSHEIPGNDRLLLASKDKNFTVIRTKSRSQEWKLLPSQSWEKFVFQKSPEVDPDGFDRRSRVAVRIAEKTNATIEVASDRIAIQGEIIHARTEYGQVFLGEQVYIRAEEQLQVGSIYSVSSGPQKIISNRDHRVGFAYDIAGKVKIIGVRDGLFIGTVISSMKPIYRNNLLIPEVQPLFFKKPIASPSVVSASVLTTDYLSSSLLGEQQLVILDVGSNEGVEPGMVFRHYLKEDPLTGEKFTTKDYLIESELQVLDVKDKFSTAIILQSRSVLHANDIVLSLTDVSDFQKNPEFQTFIQEPDSQTPLDDLDQLDDSQGLGEKEDHELRQLEKADPKEFEELPSTPETEAATPPSTAPTPESKESDLDSEAPVINTPPATAPTDGTPATPTETPEETSPDLFVPY